MIFLFSFESIALYTFKVPSSCCLDLTILSLLTPPKMQCQLNFEEKRLDSWVKKFDLLDYFLEIDQEKSTFSTWPAPSSINPVLIRYYKYLN